MCRQSWQKRTKMQKQKGGVDAVIIFFLLNFFFCKSLVGYIFFPYTGVTHKSLHKNKNTDMTAVHDLMWTLPEVVSLIHGLATTWQTVEAGRRGTTLAVCNYPLSFLWWARPYSELWWYVDVQHGYIATFYSHILIAHCAHIASIEDSRHTLRFPSCASSGFLSFIRANNALPLRRTLFVKLMWTRQENSSPFQIISETLL